MIRKDDTRLGHTRPRTARDEAPTTRNDEGFEGASRGPLAQSMLRRAFSDSSDASAFKGKLANKGKPAKKIDRRHRLGAYLDRIWNTIFDEGASVLLSPGELVREGRNRGEVRAQELSYIELAESDLRAVHLGSKTIDEFGYIKDSPRSPSDDIKMSPLIERVEAEADDAELRLGANALLKHISHEVRIKELKRSLHIRKVAIFAEQQAIVRYQGRCSNREVDLDWVERWKEYAQDTHAEGMQKLWAGVLAMEVLKPGGVSMMTLDFLRHLSSTDLELLKIAAKLSFGAFIYREAKGYFTDEIHRGMFEKLEEMGLLQGVKQGGGWMPVISKSASIESCNTLLRCHNKALFIETLYPGQGLKLPIYLTSSLGKEVLSVTGVDADMAYLWAVANEIKSRGCSVQLGDWLERPGEKGAFQQKIIV